MSNSSPPSRAASGSKRTRLSVVPKSAGWAIQKSGSARASRVYRTQREAMRAAKELVRSAAGGEVVVHCRNGRIRSVESYALGADSFDSVSAMEGIFLTQEMKRDFRALDRRRLSPEARRQWLIAKYGKQPHSK